VLYFLQIKKASLCVKQKKAQSESYKGSYPNKKASDENNTELSSVSCLHTMLEIYTIYGGLLIRYKDNI
jgi:hypothetical protein